MKVEYAPRAVTDLVGIGDQSRRVFGAPVAAVLETTIRATIARIRAFPEIGQKLQAHPKVRVIPLGRYPFKIFHTIGSDTVTILHIRHAARRPWTDP